MGVASAADEAISTTPRGSVSRCVLLQFELLLRLVQAAPYPGGKFLLMRSAPTCCDVMCFSLSLVVRYSTAQNLLGIMPHMSHGTSATEVHLCARLLLLAVYSSPSRVLLLSNWWSSTAGFLILYADTTSVSRNKTSSFYELFV
jgi:hypothetical protein